MKRFFPSDAEALLSGRLAPDDAPPELAELASLIEAARAPASARELAGETHLVAAIAAAVRGTVEIAPVPAERRPRVFGKALSTRVIALSTALLLSGGAVAAAATGALPASIQTTVAHGLAHLGISVPSPAVNPSPVQSKSKDRSSGARTAKPGKGPVSPGLCALYQHSNSESSATTGTKTSSPAFSRLAAAARAKGETIDEYCQRTAPLSTTSSTAPGSVHRPSTPVPSSPATSTPASPPANTSVGTSSSGRGTANTGTGQGGGPTKSLPTTPSIPTRQGPPSTTPADIAPSNGTSRSTAPSTTTPSTTPGSTAPSTTVPSTSPAGNAASSGTSGSTAGTGVPVHVH